MTAASRNRLEPCGERGERARNSQHAEEKQALIGQPFLGGSPAPPYAPEEQARRRKDQEQAAPQFGHDEKAADEFKEQFVAEQGGHADEYARKGAPQGIAAEPVPVEGQRRQVVEKPFAGFFVQKPGCPPFFKGGADHGGLFLGKLHRLLLEDARRVRPCGG